MTLKGDTQINVQINIGLDLCHYELLLISFSTPLDCQIFHPTRLFGPIRSNFPPHSFIWP